MLKIVGLCLVVTAGVGMGFAGSYELTLQERELETLYRMTVLLRGEIRCKKAGLSDAFSSVSRKFSGEYRKFLLDMAGQMEENKGKPFEQIFRECALAHQVGSKLEKTQKEGFFYLGKFLGYLDLDMQQKQLALYEKELKEERKKLHSGMKDRKKLYQSLGIMGGIMLALLMW